MWPRTSTHGASRPPPPPPPPPPPAPPSPFPTGRECTADVPLCAPSSSPALWRRGFPGPPPPQAMSRLGLPPRATICIKGLPPTVDNSQNLLPFVPREGLIALRVKRSGGRDVGFAEYDSGKSAHEALQWFYRLRVTTNIAYSCLSHMPPSCDIPPLGYRYPVPYVEYNNCIGDSSRTMDLLLKSVILDAEWSDSSPTCRPNFVPSRTSPNPYFDQQNQQNYGCIPSMAMTPERISQPPQFGFHSTPLSHTGPIPETHSRPDVPGLQNISWDSRPKSTECCHAISVESGWNQGCMTHPSKVGMSMQSGVKPQRHRWHSQPQQAWGQTSTEGDIHMHGTSSITQSDSSRACLSDSTLPSFILDDKDLPSSTLFVRALRYRPHHLQQNTSSFRAASSSPISGRAEEEIVETSYDSGTSVPSEHQYQQRRQQQQQLDRVVQEWACLHHHHHFSAYPEVQSNIPSSIPCNASAHSGMPAEVQEGSPTFRSLSSSHTGDDTITNEVIKGVLNRDFFSERFAGFCSYKSFGKQCGFVRFETSEDARQCLCWLRRQQNLRPFISVQFARQDTRSCRFHKRGS
ncbi:uncharacterized protein TM35_000161380 [Trypanosoma theileri]|uniref:Uncharacterized protein n=1 Tax=Trypanosoma theileri TaxID=67003 RepID=A0A1X0NWL5_9TRYP|nr:uncharacterized protein TM35_000161380 [Trypanosoma theileri]ORC88500.1 hypothetical protein TM35_000161380 [Trypanosoma theileri]